VKKDAVLTAFALIASSYEIIYGGGRATVLAFLATLLGIPIASAIGNRRNGSK
jgi:hypothetical protein